MSALFFFFFLEVGWGGERFVFFFFRGRVGR